MIVVISLILLITLGITILLLTNKGQESEKAKMLLKEILINIKDLFINLKDFSILIKEIIQKLLQNNDEESQIPESKIKESKVNSNEDLKESSIEGTKNIEDVLPPQSNEKQEPIGEVFKSEINIDIKSSEVDDSNKISQSNNEESPFSKESISEINNKDEDLAS